MNEKDRQKKREKKRAAKERQRKKLHQGIETHPAPSTSQAWTVKPPTRFQIVMGPDVMVGLGPMAAAVWSVPSQRVAALTAEGKAIPPPVTGHLLVDTGATGTCIALHAAEQLGLKPHATTPNHGAHGEHESQIFLVHFSLAIRDGNGPLLAIEREMSVPAIPDMQLAYAKLQVQMNGQPLNVIGVLGRDFLRHARMTYDGPRGIVEIEMNLAGMGPLRHVVVAAEPQGRLPPV